MADLRQVQNIIYLRLEGESVLSLLFLFYLWRILFSLFFHITEQRFYFVYVNPVYDATSVQTS